MGKWTFKTSRHPVTYPLIKRPPLRREFGSHLAHSLPKADVFTAFLDYFQWQQTHYFGVFSLI